MSPRDLAPEKQTTQETQYTSLRLLASTDVHMHFLAHDYVTDGPSRSMGLVGLSKLIEDARAEAAAEGMSCLLVDNGDLLQGNALGDFLATQPVNQRHPVVAALRHMKYDAIGIGNHDLDHGLPYLEAFAEHLPIPVVSTNLELNAPSAIRRSTIVSLPVTTSPDNKIRKLRIGILSVLPAQTEIWNHHVLDGKARIAQPSASLRAAVSRLRAKGAEMVVLLAHMGIDAFAHHHDIRENALNLAKIPGIDAIVAGHTHRRFPGTDHKARSGVDTVSGMLANRPAVMAGHKGSDLAVLDLRLSRQSTGDWKVARHQSSLRPNGLGNAPDPQIMTFCAVAHKVTRTRLAEPVGKSDVAMNNFFSLASPTLTSALVANAKARAAREALVGMPEARLPLLVTATAHTAGGRGGPDNYLNLPAGTILRRHLAGLCPYANTI